MYLGHRAHFVDLAGHGLFLIGIFTRQQPDQMVALQAIFNQFSLMERAIPTASGTIMNGTATVLRKGRIGIIFGIFGWWLTFSSDGIELIMNLI
ncbi:MAG: hypothetical protein PVJ84_11325 [Desulfobacteraceae bacterium]